MDWLTEFAASVASTRRRLARKAALQGNRRLEMNMKVRRHQPSVGAALVESHNSHHRTDVHAAPDDRVPLSGSSHVGMEHFPLSSRYRRRLG